MELFQIVEVTENFNHAGTKATADIACVADELGFSRIHIRMDSVKESKTGKLVRQMGYFRDWKQCEKEIPEGAIVLLQHPFHHKQLTREKTLRKLKSDRHVHYISLVHDVEELRAFRYNDYYAREFRTMLELADVLIVHNRVMRQWFADRGIPEEKLIDLEIFDYLQVPKEEKQPLFSASITIAGNLDTEKCGYIRQLGELDGIGIHLYGPNFDERMRNCQNVTYHGSFPVDEIPDKLDCGFGLVWDGESIDGCKGLSGQYLKYNNPHKLSLYLSSGIPVVIWKDAAEADFVRENHVGLCVDTISELETILPKMSEDDYRLYSDALKNVKKKLQTGFYAKNALQEAITRVTRRKK